MNGTCMQGPTRVAVIDAIAPVMASALAENPAFSLGSISAAGVTQGLDNAAFFNGFDPARFDAKTIEQQTIALTDLGIGVDVGVASGFDFGR